MDSPSTLPIGKQLRIAKEEKLSDSMVSEEQTSEKYGDKSLSEEIPWIKWFTSLPGHEFLCEVSEDYLSDDFNLEGIADKVPHFEEAMELIVDIGPMGDFTNEEMQAIQLSAGVIYCLIHYRYLLSREGQRYLMRRYLNSEFGFCPRTLCFEHPVLPVGISLKPSVSSFKLFCPRCMDIYNPIKNVSLDGCSFGMTPAHLLVHSSPEILNSLRMHYTSKTQLNIEYTNSHFDYQDSMEFIYVPRIYGFRIHKSAKNGQKMEWLRRKNYVDISSMEERISLHSLDKEDSRLATPVSSVFQNDGV
jgi:casein kinase II subunit beta